MTPSWAGRVKRLAIHVLYFAGILHLWKFVALRRRAVVLMYHRVLPKERLAETWSHRGIIVTPETFEKHMRFLREHFRVLSPAEFQQRLESGDRFDNASCLVTFDDGWLDTYTEALPVLRRYQVPALVFLPSAYMGTGEMFWQERLGAALNFVWHESQRDRHFKARAHACLDRFGLASVLDEPADRIREHIIEVVRDRKAVHRSDPFEPLRAIAELSQRNGDEAVVDRFMNWDQARVMCEDGIAFGVHGETHRQLTALTQDEVQRELDTCRRALEEALGARPTAVSYPNGDCNATVLDVARRSDFSVGFTTQPGRVSVDTDRLLVRRVNIHEDATSSMPMFLAKLVGVV